MYKLLAIDMDGTVLNSEKKITPKTIEAINYLLKKGIQVVVATGRCLVELDAYREAFKNMNYGILTSGGMIYDFFEDKPLAIHAVPFEDCLKLIALGEEEGAMVHLLTIKYSIAKPQDIANMANFGMEIYQSMFEKICVKCEDLERYAHEHKAEVMKVNLYHRTAESRDRTVERLKDRKLELVFAETKNLEASPLGITKASGLIELCKILNIDISETVAIGDAPNDTEILQTAGYSVAMGNASDEIKEIADFVTVDNDHDGVAVAIEKIFDI